MGERGRDHEATSPPPDGTAAATAVGQLVRSECITRLRQASLGRLAFLTDGWPVVVPVNYVLDGETIVFRTDPGAKLDAVLCSPRVAFEVDSFDALYTSGWSVLVHGIAKEVAGEERDRLAATIRLRSWAGGPKSHWIRVPMLQVTGRALPRAWAYPGPVPSS
jgi:uncharacterized protein